LFQVKTTTEIRKTVVNEVSKETVMIAEESATNDEGAEMLVTEVRAGRSP
jgi:hypothetical protein